jgi:hypothetical protein
MIKKILSLLGPLTTEDNIVLFVVATPIQIKGGGSASRAH